MATSLSDQLPHVVVNDEERKQVHVVPVFTIRQVANGQKEDKELSRIIAKALLNELKS